VGPRTGPDDRKKENSYPYWDLELCSLGLLARSQLLSWFLEMSDSKVRELATVCLPWQQWTETSVWFDEVGIIAFHSCVVVDLWQSLSEGRLLLSECVLVSCITTMHMLTRHCL
jgi:hypothetical protein